MNEFKTSDIALGATLYSMGFSLNLVERENEARATFCFKRDELIDEVVQQYFSRSVRIEPMTFSASLKALKTRLYHT